MFLALLCPSRGRTTPAFSRLFLALLCPSIADDARISRLFLALLCPSREDGAHFEAFNIIRRNALRRSSFGSQVLRLAPLLPIPIGGYNYLYGATDLALAQFVPAMFLGSLKPYGGRAEIMATHFKRTAFPTPQKSAGNGPRSPLGTRSTRTSAERRSCRLVLALLCASRGRHQHSNAAKIIEIGLFELSVADAGTSAW